MSPLLLNVTPIYAVLLTLLYITLTIRIIKARWAHKVSFMDGGVDELTRAIRAHGNFIEYVPLCLLLMAFGELNGASDWTVHITGAILLISRILHSISLVKGILKMRIWGMTATFLSLTSALIVLIYCTFISSLL
ncbi:MAG: MAPEG family protein [Methylocystaceae bacterium]|nr:MAPEG family protein [Methylocystaceae bacterium]